MTRQGCPDLADACFRAAFSLTLPHLEPYLIRTYRGLVDTIRHEPLAAEIVAFCAQEAQHHRNHAQVNRIIRDQLGPATGTALLGIEQETYVHRVAAGLTAQRHFFGYLDRLHRVLAAHHGLRPTRLPYVPKMLRAGWRRYLWTFHPAYDPAKIEVPAVAHRLLEHVTAATPGGGEAP